MACFCAMAAHFARADREWPRNAAGVVPCAAIHDRQQRAERMHLVDERAWLNRGRATRIHGIPRSMGLSGEAVAPGRLKLFETSKCNLRNASRAILAGCTCNMQSVHIGDYNIYQTRPNRRIASFVSTLARRREGRGATAVVYIQQIAAGIFRMDLYMAAFWIRTPARRRCYQSGHMVRIGSAGWRGMHDPD
jgi:hypothetical protein